jgi:DNA-binding IclR family transcriptional regulator
MDSRLTTPAGIHVLRALVAHPSDDTAADISKVSGLPLEEVDATLADLKHRHLARRWETHWQITSLGVAAASAGP